MTMPHINLPHHRVWSEDVPNLRGGKRVRVRMLEPPQTIGVGHILRYLPAPPRLVTARANHPTAELVPCSSEEVLITFEIPLAKDHQERWLVCQATRYDLTLVPFN